MVVALLVGGVCFAIAGFDVPELASEVVSSVRLGSAFGLEDLGLLFSPLILTGLAAAVAIRIGLWNIGGEGQFYAGAICASVVGLYVDGPALGDADRHGGGGDRRRGGVDPDPGFGAGVSCRSMRSSRRCC